MTWIVIGIVIPAFASSPDKNKGDKTKTENLTPSSLPPSPWNLYIHVTDASDSTCLPALNCNLAFFWQTASLNCEAIFENPTGKVPFHFGTANYTVPIPDTIKCVQVSIIVLPPGCTSTINPNTCCTCKSGSGNPCILSICH